MFEIYNGDFLLFATDDAEEAYYYQIEGYIVKHI